MAYLLNTHTNKKQYLLNHHTFGRRSEVVDTYIDKPEISKIHAVIEWTDQKWHIRNFGRNNTWVDQKKLEPTHSQTLKIGQTIRFADPQFEGWVIKNLDPPCDLLIGLNEYSITQNLSHFTLLPNEEAPLAALFFCQVSKQWLLEGRNNLSTEQDKSDVGLIDNQQTVSLEHFQWRMMLINDEPQTVNLSPHPFSPHQCTFNFDVSLDEEHIQLNLDQQGETIDFGGRSHHYLLLHLARIKARHAREGIDINNQGWIGNDQLERELGIDNAHINIQIFRARKQLAHAFPNTVDLASLLERRRGSIRFNCAHAIITKGEHQEHIGN